MSTNQNFSLLRGLGSLTTTLVLLLATAAILLYARALDTELGWVIGLPFVGMTLNLIAAVAVNARLRTQGGLLVFHLSLAALAAVVAIGRLVVLNGHVELTEGSAFSSTLVTAQAGPLHPWGFDNVRFVQNGFSIDYGAGMSRRATRSEVLVPNGNGRWKRVLVGDDAPLIANGYRFYTTFNKGFAPVLTYIDRTGRARSGSVHIPPYPLVDYDQGNQWTPPGRAQPIKLWLHMEKPVYDEHGAWRFEPPKDATLVITADGRRSELRPGDRTVIGDGVLRYDELRKWMGYSVFYDPTVPWILAAAMAAVAGLAWHVVGRIRSTPWDQDERESNEHGVV